ncbi:MAG: L-ribulose-5-phosphate 4-epimerase [Terriglobales bacterium]|jgi:L-ribulose-5-phosphate 4-epimerase
MLERLREQVLEANLELVRQGLVRFTFGNASAISRKEGLVVIKPSGVPYSDMRPEHLVVTDLQGKTVEGHLRPSSDLPTHLVLYDRFREIGGVAHTHSEYATAWAQARQPIPCFGTTHADYFHGEVPVTAEMADSEIAEDYEENTGHVIVRSLQSTDPMATPGILVANHGPFAWGQDVRMAAHHAAILESIARMAYFTLGINSHAQPAGRALRDKHYLRKHGKNAYYGQAQEQGKARH